MEPNKELKQQSLEYLSKLYNEGYVEKRYKMFDDGEGGIPHEWGQLRTAFESGANTWKAKYDELKAENEYLNKLVDDLRQSVGSQIELTRKALAEHQALKEKAEKMATALKES